MALPGAAGIWLASVANSMSRAPASLSYLVIYNPSLRAADAHGSSDDDEDAHERAQILFYTASERAVSRDRMLRQVGLAQALISFTEYVTFVLVCIWRFD